MSGEPLVVDASVAIEWVVAEEGSREADILLDGRRLTRSPSAPFIPRTIAST